ncbi:MAG: DUF1007 family protein [Candidatus Goldbacteria bacterium]|nr:DUF1007 family protein [Candidatus Goldiibacteriota bacterium]
MKKMIFLFIMILFTGLSLDAHPHYFITPNVFVYTDLKGLKEIEVEWVFDRMTSVSLFEYIDSDGDGEISEAEIDKIRKKDFKSLSAYNYYTFIIVDGGKPLKIDPYYFSIETGEDQEISYIFKAKVNMEIKRKFKLYFEDSEIYIAFDLFEENIVLKGNEEMKLKFLEGDYGNAVEAYY